MTDFLRREYFFLRRPLNVGSRLFLLLGAVVLVVAVFQPMWRIRLIAPQYQEGLELRIFTHKLEGGNRGQDLHEINVLNHYIGMRSIAAADFVEMKWMPFALGVFVLLTLRAAVLGRMLSLVDLIALFAYFGAFSVGNFAYRLHAYGHTLDPRAPMTIEPFTPVILGTQKIANFVQSSYPQAGAVLLAVFPVCVLMAMWLSRKESVL